MGHATAACETGEGPLTGGFPCQMAIFPGSLVGAFDRGIPCQMLQKVIRKLRDPPDSIQFKLSETKKAKRLGSRLRAASAVADKAVLHDVYCWVLI